MEEKDLRKINNELKSFVNQANFISQKTRNKLIKMLGETFEISLPLENFANIDVQLTAEGNILMRGDLYRTPNQLTEKEILDKYNLFKEKADALINKKEVNYYNKKDLNNILNIFIVIFLSIAYLVIGFIFIMSLLRFNFLLAGILAATLSSSLIPNIRARFEQAKNFFKRKFKGQK